MLTNINHKPVVTWRDLRNGFGYRLPYGIDIKVNDYGTSFLLKGVTYKDLENCAKGYISEYKSQFDQLTDAQKRMYITNKAAISTIVHPVSSFTLTPASDVGHFTTSGTFTGGTPFKFIADPISEMKEIVWFTFMADQSLHNCSVTWDKLDLVATHTTAGPTNASVILQGQILVRRVGTTANIGRGTVPVNNISVDGTYEPINVFMPTTFTSVKKGSVYEVVLSVYTSVSYKGDINIPSVTAELPLKPILPGLTTTTITFYSKDATLSLESNNKCVTYDLVKANTKASLPVRMYLKNGMKVISYINYCRAIYKYKLVGSNTWSEKILGTLRIGHNSDGTGYAKSGASGSLICDCPVMPVDGEVAADYLQFSSGDAQTAQDFSITLEMGDSVQYLSSTKSTLNLVIGCTGQSGDNPAYAGCYIDNLTKLTGISLVYS